MLIDKTAKAPNVGFAVLSALECLFVLSEKIPEILHIAKVISVPMIAV